MKKKIAVLFPGIGYTCDKPLLYYTGKLAVARGYKLVKVEYGNFPSGIKENKEKMEEAFRCGLEQAEKILQDICWEEYEDILFVSKSIGTSYLLHLPEGINSQRRIFYLHHFSRHFYLQMGMGLYFMERQTHGLIQRILQKDVKS